MGFYLLERHKSRDVPRVAGKGRPWYPTRLTCRHGYNTPHLIVLHSAENLPDWDGPDAGAENVAAYGATTERASWHWTVDSDSSIAMLPHPYTAFHVRDYNRCSVGVEIATQAGKWLEAPLDWLHELYDTLADVLVTIKDDTGIPLIDRRTDPSKWGVTVHSVLDPSRRTDPGQAFPFDWILQMANGGFRYKNPPPPVIEPPLPPERPLGAVSLLADDTIRRMQDWARLKNGTPLFVELAQTAYTSARSLGVSPLVVYAIMGHETRFGHFGGVLDVSFCNWGGIKTRLGGSSFDPQAHQRFTSHRIGVRAVAEHVAGYAGLRVFEPFDPRFSLLANKRIESLPSDDWTWASTEHDSNVVRYVLEMQDA